MICGVIKTLGISICCNNRTLNTMLSNGLKKYAKLNTYCLTCISKNELFRKHDSKTKHLISSMNQKFNTKLNLSFVLPQRHSQTRKLLSVCNSNTFNQTSAELTNSRRITKKHQRLFEATTFITSTNCDCNKTT